MLKNDERLFPSFFFQPSENKKAKKTFAKSVNTFLSRRIFTRMYYSLYNEAVLLATEYIFWLFF